MPVARPVRHRTITNENDENATNTLLPSTRLTRAKAASLTVGDDPAGITNVNGLVKKPLGLKKTSASTNAAGLGAAGSKHRATLGDISNVTKGGEANGLNGDHKDATKRALGLTSANVRTATTTTISNRSSGLTKTSRTVTSSTAARTALGSKDHVSNKITKESSKTGVRDTSSKTLAREQTVHREVAKDHNTSRPAARKPSQSSDRKRPASGLSGVVNESSIEPSQVERGGKAKKRNTGSTGSTRSRPGNSAEDEKENVENEPPVVPLSKAVSSAVLTTTTGPTLVKSGQDAYTASTSVAAVGSHDLFPGEQTQASTDVLDLDAEDYGDPLMVSEYVVEIFDHLRSLEDERMANPDYMDAQKYLQWNLRGVLVDWLIEVHTRFHLLPETLFLTVNIIDRFLSRRVIELDKLQLVGITAMFIASKYEEVLSPHVQNFKHVADDGFSEDEILKAERFVLATLNYDLSYPNPMNFLRRISKADNYDIQTRTVGKYLLEISLLDHRFLCFAPSHVCAAAMYLARMILLRGEWNDTIAAYAGYTEAEILPVFRLLIDYLRAPVTHEAFFKKYASKKFLKASILSRSWAKQYHTQYLGVDDPAADGNNDSFRRSSGESVSLA